MPSLTSTQVPLLRRDITNGLVPPPLLDETQRQYHIRLGIIYYLPPDVVCSELSQ
jgi:hypothetical protein